MAGEQQNSETIVWRPIKDIEQAMDDMEQTYEETMGRPFFPLAWSRTPTVRAWTPPAEIIDNADAFVIRFEVPGAMKDSIDITATRNSITVRGEINASAETQPPNYYLCERCYGPFSRSIDFPMGIEPDQIKAELDMGVLTLTVPKSAESVRKKVNVGDGRMQSTRQTGGQEGMQTRPYGQESARRGMTPSEPAAGERQGQIGGMRTTGQTPYTPQPGREKTGAWQNPIKTPENEELSKEAFKYEQTARSPLSNELPGWELPGQSGEVGEENRSGIIRVVPTPMRVGSNPHSSQPPTGQGQQREMSQPGQPRNTSQTPENAELAQEEFEYEQTKDPAIRGNPMSGELPGQTGEVGEVNRSGNVRVFTARPRERGNRGGMSGSK